MFFQSAIIISENKVLENSEMDFIKWVNEKGRYKWTIYNKKMS